MVHRHLFNFFMFFIFLSAFGCGTNIKATGTVKYADGKPLTQGTVVLQNDQHQYIGHIQPNGTFRTSSYKEGDGLPEGVYQVAVLNAYDEQDRPLIAEKYMSVSTSELKYEIGPDHKTLEITVEYP